MYPEPIQFPSDNSFCFSFGLSVTFASFFAISFVLLVSFVCKDNTFYWNRCNIGVTKWQNISDFMKSKESYICQISIIYLFFVSHRFSLWMGTVLALGTV